jgi:4-hydroxybutyryl-CoA dehydratase/vinylacetyl-CoA-Delta-isomerase
MVLKKGDDYLNSIKSLRLKAHVLGEKPEDLHEHGLVEPSQKAVAFTFDAAQDKHTRDLFCVESSLCKEVVNRFTHLHQSADDLINKVKMQRYCGVQTGCCFQRCVGLDAANAMHGAGPPTAQRIMIRRQANLDGKIDKVKDFLGIK